MINSLPAQTSYFSISTALDRDTMTKIAIALDIVRKYLDNQEKLGSNVKIFSIDGFGEKLSFRDLCLGTWMVFDCIYGRSGQPIGYPIDMEFLGGEGVMGWNREVTNPTIDIPKALTIYQQISASASSYPDKFSRMKVMKKLFYRTDSSNRFFTEKGQTYKILADENPDFYNFIVKRIQDLINLAQNESKTVAVPTKLTYVFDKLPYATKYDAEEYSNMSYMRGLLNLNSVIIKANKLYLSFLTSFEQVLYHYTKQAFPIKLYGTITYLFNSYLKIIINYMKPYHSKLIENFPNLKIGGDLLETVTVGDVARVNSTLQIFTDIIKWRFDNPYDFVPENYDSMDKIIDFIKTVITTKIEDQERTNHRIDYDILTLDDRSNHIYEDISIKADCKVFNASIEKDSIPGNLYPSKMLPFTNSYIEYNLKDKTLKNISDRDLVFITDNYCMKGSYRISNIIIDRELDFLENNVKIGIMTTDTNTVSLYVDGKWKRVKNPVVNDVLRGNNFPNTDLSKVFAKYNTNKDFIVGPGDLMLPESYYNFIKFILYIPKGETAYLPIIDYEYRIKFV